MAEEQEPGKFFAKTSGGTLKSLILSVLTEENQKIRGIAKSISVIILGWKVLGHRYI